ncbi:MAG: hypothetical protein PHH58_15935 [Rhodoferax sp.]|nr:hypothetical protein [Rhodoferax sp.]
MNKTMKSLCAASVLAVLSAVALAKLPPPSDAAKAKADEAKAKAAWAGKAGGYKLCLAQNKVVAHYKKMPEPKVAKAPAKGASAAPAAGGCADPGPFVYTPAVPVTAAAPAAPAPAAPAAVAVAKQP